MAELKTKPTDASVADFIAGIENEQRRTDCEALLALMREIIGGEPKLWGTNIVGFGSKRYKYASGREGDWFRAGFSPRKTHTTLYAFLSLDEQSDLLEKLGKHTHGQSCLHFKKLADLDWNVLKELIARCNIDGA
jgi:hypothetical protein